MWPHTAPAGFCHAITSGCQASFRRVSCLLGYVNRAVLANLRLLAAASAVLMGTAAAGDPAAARDLQVMRGWADAAPDLAVPIVPPGPAEVCKVAAVEAESGLAVPPGLLLAIARVETGRRDAKSGLLEPWPWSVNAQGQSLFFQTKLLAVEWVRQAQKSGLTSIDVGCMQVNLQYHPLAFRTLEDAFDPRQNARYAVSFLSSLHAEAGDWMRAAGLYHSRNDILATPYRQQVANNVARSDAPSKQPLPTMMQTLRAAWGATLVPIGVTEPSQAARWSAAPRLAHTMAQ